MGFRAVLPAAGLAVFLAACGTGGSAPAPAASSSAQAHSSAPATSPAITHPSEPNYLALFSGSTQGVTDDSCPHRFSAPNLASGLLAAGRTFAGYAEDLPTTGSAVCSAGEYARRHVPLTGHAATAPLITGIWRSGDKRRQAR